LTAQPVGYIADRGIQLAAFAADRPAAPILPRKRSMPPNDFIDGTGLMAGNATPAPEARAPASGEFGAFAWRVVITLLLLMVAYLLVSGIHVLLLTFGGILLAVTLESASRWLSDRTGWPRRLALAATVLVLVLLMGALTWLFANTLINQLTEFAENLPQLLHQVQQQLHQYSWGKYLLDRIPQAAESVAKSSGVSPVTDIASGAAYFLEAVVLILIVGIFGAASPDVYKRGLLHLVPLCSRQRVSQALSQMACNLRGWLLGQLLLMAIVGATAALTLWLVGVPLALTLGLITGVMEIVPYVGAWIAFLPAALMSLQLGPWYLVMTAGIYLGLHLLEGYLVGPLVQRWAVHLPPALTIVAQILLGEIFGLVGLLVAAPLTVAVIVFVKYLYVEDTLGDSIVSHPRQGDDQEAAGCPRPEHAPAGGS
jgi:predicted PurR-regulated permease PerM